MDNIITYAEQTMETFSQLPLSDVDSLILSCVAYLDNLRLCCLPAAGRGFPCGSCSAPSTLTGCFL